MTSNSQMKQKAIEQISTIIIKLMFCIIWKVL